MSANAKPYGWEVTVELVNGDRKTFHYVGTKGNCMSKALLKPLATHVVSTNPVSREQWERAYGVPGLRM